MNHSSFTASAAHLKRGDLPALASIPRAAGEVFLEALQQRVYAAIGVTAEDCQRREWAGQQTILPLRLQQKANDLSPAEFAQYRAAVLDALTRDELLPRPTAFERPHQYSILRELKGSIETAAAELSIKLPFVPVIGTLPTRLLEPLMVPMPATDEVVLVVDGTLLTFVHLLAKAVAHAIPVEMLDTETLLATPPPAGWEQNIDPDGRATTRFAELMLAAMGGHAASAPTYSPDPVCEQITAALCDCMELFIVAREYARLCEGHFLVAESERRHACDQPFEALVWTAQQEFHADALGLGLLLSAANEKGESPTLAFWSAEILLMSLGALDQSLMTMESPMAVPLMTLPPTIFARRRVRLRSMVEQLQGGSAALTFAQTMEPVVTTLAERFDFMLHEMRFGPRPRH